MGTLRGQALRQVLATHRQILVNLAAAGAAHDPRARAHYRAELRALCDPAGVTTARGCAARISPLMATEAIAADDRPMPAATSKRPTV